MGRDVTTTGCRGVCAPTFENFRYFPAKICIFIKKKIVRWKNEVLYGDVTLFLFLFIIKNKDKVNLYIYKIK